MSERYFVLTCSEDGDVRVEAFSKAEVADKLNSGWWGESERAPKWCARLPDANPQCWNGFAVIIKGEIVRPEPREVVRSYEVP